MTTIIALPSNSATGNYSTNGGVTWSAMTHNVGTGPGIIKSAWNGTVFCAVGPVAPNVATSPDGVTWTAQTIAANSYKDIAWNGTVFCAVCTGGSCYTSPDGITWTARTMGLSTNWAYLCVSGTTFFAFSSSASTLPYYSSDGITWNSASQAPFGTTPAASVTAFPGKLCAIRNGSAGVGAPVAISSNGAASWTTGAMPVTTNASFWSSVAWNGTIFCAVGYEGTTYNGLCATSTDGVTWTAGTIPNAALWLSVAWDGTEFVAIAQQTSAGAGTIYAVTSTNGTAWTTQTMATSQYWSSVSSNYVFPVPPPSFGSGSNVFQVITTNNSALTIAFHTLAAYTISASALAGAVQTIEPLTISADAVTGVVTTAYQIPLALELWTGGGSTANIAIGYAALRAYLVAANGSTSVLASGNQTLLSITFSAFGYVPQIGAGAVSLQAIRSAGVSFTPVGGQSFTISMHTEKQALSSYSNFRFNSYALFNGVPLGANESGLFALIGDTDAGAPVVAVVRTGVVEYNTSKQKRLDHVYLGYKSAGNMNLRAYTDGDIPTDYVVPSPATATLQPVRVLMAKGIASRYWQFEVQNPDGADFTLDSLECKSTVLNRHTPE